MAASTEAVDEALNTLELDPYYFRSGYHRDWLACVIAQVPLTAAQIASVRSLVVGLVDGTRHGGRGHVVALARASLNNALRRTLRDRLHSPDPVVAARALHLLVHVRHPGLTNDDLAAARLIVLRAVARKRWSSPAAEARWLWSEHEHFGVDGFRRRWRCRD